MRAFWRLEILESFSPSCGEKVSSAEVSSSFGPGYTDNRMIETRILSSVPRCTATGGLSGRSSHRSVRLFFNVRGSYITDISTGKTTQGLGSITPNVSSYCARKRSLQPLDNDGTTARIKSLPDERNIMW